MIRSTVNATTMTVRRSGIRSEAKELVYGSSDGAAPSANAELTEAEYDALTSNTYGPLHSKEHWDGTTLIRS